MPRERQRTGPHPPPRSLQPTTFEIDDRDVYKSHVEGITAKLKSLFERVANAANKHDLELLAATGVVLLQMPGEDYG